MDRAGGPRRGRPLLGPGRPPQAAHLGRGWRRSWPGADGQGPALCASYYSVTVRPTDQEQLPLEGNWSHAHTSWGRAHGEARGSVRRQRDQGECGQESSCGLQGKEPARQGSRFRVGWFEWSRWLGGTGTVWFLVPEPGCRGWGTVAQWVSPQTRCWVWTLDWLVCAWKEHSVSCALSRSHLGGAVPPEPAAPDVRASE